MPRKNPDDVSRQSGAVTSMWRASQRFHESVFFIIKFVDKGLPLFPPEWSVQAASGGLQFGRLSLTPKFLIIIVHRQGDIIGSAQIGFQERIQMNMIVISSRLRKSGTCPGQVDKTSDHVAKHPEAPHQKQGFEPLLRMEPVVGAFMP